MAITEPDGRVSELRVALTVTDVEQALAFFREALGLPQVADWSSPAGRCLVLSAGRATIEILDAGHAAHVDQMEVGRRVSGPVRLAVEVPDSAAALDRLRDAGAEVVAEVTTTPWGDRNGRVEAPAGLQLTVFSGPADGVSAFDVRD